MTKCEYIGCSLHPYCEDYIPPCAENSNKVLEQCKTRCFKGTRACMNHGYPADVIEKSCRYKVGVDAQFALDNLAGTFIIKNLPQQERP